jgi:hypothetical protein
MLDRANVKISMLTWALYQLQVVQEALDQANVSETDLSAVAVTIGPGLSLCLRGNLSDISSKIYLLLLMPTSWVLALSSDLEVENFFAWHNDSLIVYK